MCFIPVYGHVLLSIEFLIKCGSTEGGGGVILAM